MHRIFKAIDNIYTLTEFLEFVRNYSNSSVVKRLEIMIFFFSLSYDYKNQLKIHFFIQVQVFFKTF